MDECAMRAVPARAGWDIARHDGAVTVPRPSLRNGCDHAAADAVRTSYGIGLPMKSSAPAGVAQQARSAWSFTLSATAFARSSPGRALRPGRSSLLKYLMVSLLGQAPGSVRP